MKYDIDSITKRKNREKKLKKIFFIIVVIIIYNIILLSISYLNRQDFNGIFGYKAYKITSSSMEPSIHTGDIVITKKPKEKEDVKEGDVVSLLNDGEIITHRIINISEVNGNTQYVTKGDNNNVEDLHRIVYEDIQGVVIITIPYLGNILSFLENQIFLLIVILIILLMYLYKITKEEKSEMRREKRKHMIKK